MDATDGKNTRNERPFDSGVIDHIRNCVDAFHTFEPKMGWVLVWNSEHVRSFGIGVAQISARVFAASHTVVIRDVTFVPDMICDPLSTCLVRRAVLRTVA